jgi:two-component system chemotaxis response regulator CheB
MIRVLVVETSTRLSAALGGAPDLEVLGPVGPREALEHLRQQDIHVVLMEVTAPAHDAHRAVERIMAERPCPVLLVASAEHRQLAFPLLAAGALDVLECPLRIGDSVASELTRQLLLLSRVRVVRHPRGHRRRTSSRLTPIRPEFPVVAVAASLGGPRALAELLADLPDEFGAPVVICQHITPGFSAGLAQWLAAETGLRVHEASDGQRLIKGEVFIAPANQHLIVMPTGLLRCESSPPVGGFRPSCDVLLSSAATAFGARAVGVVLTGMGRDGAHGLLEIRNRGGHTIAQDQATSAVFGMPGEAVALNAAEKVLPIGEIAEQLTRWIS